jgi:hypothetical protein
MITSFQINTNVGQSQQVSILEEFKNIMPMGRYFYYQLNPGSSDGFGFLDKLTIKL